VHAERSSYCSAKLQSSFLPTYSLTALILIQLGMTQVKDLAYLRQCLIDARCKALCMVLLMNGIRDFTLVWIKPEAS